MASAVLALSQIKTLLVLIVLFLAGLPVVLVGILLRDEDKRPMDYVRDVLATPKNVLKENLGPDERVLSWSRPAITAYLWKERRLSLQTFLSGLFWLFILINVDQSHWQMLVPFLVFQGHILYLVYKRVEDLYTLYVFTNRRVMRMSGVFNRDTASIDWPRIVDFSWQQAFLGRLLGFATLRVDSASEKANLKELVDIPGRFKINRIMVEQLGLHES